MVHQYFSLCRCGVCEAFFVYQGSEGIGCMSLEESTTNIAVCSKCCNERNELQVRIRLLTDEEAIIYSELGHDSEERRVYIENFHNAFGDSEELLIPAFMRRKVTGHVEYENKIKSLRNKYILNLCLPTSTQ